MHWTDIESTREGHAEPSSTLSRKALLQKGWQSHVRTPHEGFRPYLDLFTSLIAPSTWHNLSQSWSTLNNHHQSQCTLLKKEWKSLFFVASKGIVMQLKFNNSWQPAGRCNPVRIPVHSGFSHKRTERARACRKHLEGSLRLLHLPEGAPKRLFRKDARNSCQR